MKKIPVICQNYNPLSMKTMMRTFLTALLLMSAALYSTPQALQLASSQAGKSNESNEANNRNHEAPKLVSQISELMLDKNVNELIKLIRKESENDMKGYMLKDFRSNLAAYLDSAGEAEGWDLLFVNQIDESGLQYTYAALYFSNSMIFVRTFTRGDLLLGLYYNSNPFLVIKPWDAAEFMKAGGDRENHAKYFDMERMRGVSFVYDYYEYLHNMSRSLMKSRVDESSAQYLIDRISYLKTIFISDRVHTVEVALTAHNENRQSIYLECSVVEYLNKAGVPMVTNWACNNL